MLILRSFALSFVILVPRIVIVPILLIAYAVAVIALGIVMVPLAMLSPVLAIIAGVLLSLAISMVPMMIGCRLGLSVRRLPITGGYGGLIAPAAIYGGIEAVGLMAVCALGAVAFTLFSPDLRFADFQSLIAFGDATVLAAALEAGGQYALAICAVGLIAMAALRAALLVPMTGAAAGRDADDTLHTPLVGFGAGLLPLTVVVLLSYVALPLMVLGTLALAPLLGMADAFQGALANIDRLDATGSWAGIGTSEVLIMVAMWIGWLWVFCLQCAGGVLSYEQRRAHHAEHRATAQATTRMAPEEARALWKSRMS